MESLYTLTKRAVRRIFKDNWDETKVLPVTIQKELLNDWLKCDEELLDDFEEENSILETVNSWRRIKRIMCPQLFVDLMNHPNVVPSFACELNHVVKDCIHWHHNGVIDNLCQWCFSDIANVRALDSADVWHRNGWLFFKFDWHTLVLGEDILREVHDSENWCSRCITRSLIDIMSDDECEDTTRYHYKMLWKHSGSYPIHGNSTVL